MDFIIPKKADRVIVVLSSNYVIRTLELFQTVSLTQKEIFIKWTQKFDFENKAQVHENIWKSFDLKSVNESFYEEISSFFVELKQHLISKNIHDERHASLFANRLIGRIIFCWFLDKKGFISSKQRYFYTEGKDATEYYQTKLEKLFFRTLNKQIKDRGDEGYDLIGGIDEETPFLNGGLFTPKNDDYFGLKKITLPADYFERLYAFLKHYNFTTDESTSSFQQVAIDPEMLGRIFENLLAEQAEETGEQARKAKGTFYTPREIVEYMCRESLREYLKSKIEETDDSEQRISQLLDSKPHEWRDQQRNYRDKLKKYKYEILESLDDIKVIDPACGSGAFPMGMLQLLLQTYERLDPTFDPYKKKIEIIKNNIFGIDIEPMAVEIARLRSWLSIIVDEELNPKAENMGIHPLPNLEFKFVCANSLIPAPVEKENNWIENSFFDDLEQKVREFFEINDVKKKEAKKHELQELVDSKVKEKLDNAGQLSTGLNMGRKFKDELKKKNKKAINENIKLMDLWGSYTNIFTSDEPVGFFETKYFFPSAKGGFDIVIGNPPYVEHKKLKGIASQLKPLYDVYTSSSDLSVYFYEKGLQLLLDNGILAYICTNKFFNTDYGRKLRQFLARKQIINLINFEQVPIFENVLVSSCITIIKNQVKIHNAKSIEYKKITDWKNYFPPQDTDLKVFDYSGEDEWRINDDGQCILKKIQSNGIAISSLPTITIRRGVTTGYDPAFIHKKNKVSNLEEGIVKLLLKGADIKKYETPFSEKRIIFTQRGIDISKYLKTRDFLKIYRDHLEPKKNAKDKLGRKPGTYNWYEIQDNTAYSDLFKLEKIVWPLTADKWGFTLDENRHFLTSGAFFLISKDISLKYILGILNSALMRFYFSQIGVMTAGGAYTLKKSTIERFVIPPITSDNQSLNKKIESLVEKILKVKKENPGANISEMEKEIDDHVYELYSLEKKEIETIKHILKK